MLTREELAGIPLFASLPPEALARLALRAADVQLNAGDYAVHEGGEPALFAVVSGRIEVVKLFDGVERRLGWRLPGGVFGEVPIALGAPFPGGYRAVEASRVLRLEVQHYYEAAAASPEVSQKLGALARERLGGLQSLAAEAPKPRATVLGAQWDPRVGDLRRFLARNQISFDWLTEDTPAAVKLADGVVLAQPTPRELAQALGLQTCPEAELYDTVIIGGGPAGMAAAVYGASEGLTTVVIEQEAPGGQAGTSSRIENYLGFPNGVSGDELSRRALQQARRLGAEILVTRRVQAIDPDTREITLDGGDRVRGRAIILATGVSWRRLDTPGFEPLIGKGVYYGAARSEVSATHGLDIHLVGAGNSAGQAALYFANHARSVTLVVRGDDLAKSMSHYLIEQLEGRANVHLALRSEVRAAHGETHLTAIDIADLASGEVTRRDSGGLFIFIGADAETAWLPPQILRDSLGYVLTGDDVTDAGAGAFGRDPYLLETSVPGIFACGDVRLSPVKRVAAAVGEGSMAIAFVHRYLAQTAG